MPLCPPEKDLVDMYHGKSWIYLDHNCKYSTSFMLTLYEHGFTTCSSSSFGMRAGNRQSVKKIYQEISPEPQTHGCGKSEPTTAVSRLSRGNP
jgi:hypothetical protein